MDERSHLRDSPRTLAEATYRQLREDIVWGKRAPGTALRSNELRAAYDIGISPLREALSRLASERLVICSGQRGFSVAPLDAEDVLDTMETRIVIEIEALRRSIRFGGKDWLAAIRENYERLSALPIPQAPGRTAADWSTQHRAFHMALLSASRSRWMIRLAGDLFDQAERHRIVAYLDAAPANFRDRDAEHLRILQAALARNEDAAAEALDSHYRRTGIGVAEKLGYHLNCCG